jgi:hypothetical protein
VLIHVKVQTWFPFRIQVYVNDHEWLARQMDRHQMPYAKLDNAFLRTSDIEKTQRLADDFEQVDWVHGLESYAIQVNPLLKQGDVLATMEEPSPHSIPCRAMTAYFSKCFFWVNTLCTVSRTATCARTWRAGRIRWQPRPTSALGRSRGFYDAFTPTAWWRKSRIRGVGGCRWPGAAP